MDQSVVTIKEEIPDIVCKTDPMCEVILAEESKCITDKSFECIIKKDGEEGKINTAHQVSFKEEHEFIIDEDSVDLVNDDVDNDISSPDEDNILVLHFADKVLVLIDEHNQQQSNLLQEECSQDPFKDSVPSEVSQNGADGKNSEPEKKFMCDICGYRSTRKARITIHQRKHSGEKPFACHLCPFKTSEKVNLNRHLKSHSNIRELKCPHCSYKGNNMTYMRYHIRTHTKEKPYACDMCDYKACIPAQLTVHKKRHSTEKPYKCSLCTYKTTVVCDLNSHLKRHSLSKPFICEFCPYRAYLKVVLNNHINKHHHQLIKHDSFNIVSTDTDMLPIPKTIIGTDISIDN